MTAPTAFEMPLNEFQQRALDLLLSQPHPAPDVVQHPYAHAIPGETNQYLTVEWPDVVKVWLYDDEIQVGDLVFERPDYPADDEQFGAMIKWVGEAFGAIE